ncbi:membrane protein BRI3 isoform X1 [Mesoplodon densirostris]|uniref:membrane protein BRI3 isoform X1 n=1 Tax=Mesoplodon densirostris TaxID=48708 RepID=UPI0028DC351C|nr:membrane protein BRI3 isoform X1 [Mesoplodon densirostris]
MDHKPLLQERPPAYNLEAGQGDFACGPHGYGAIPAAAAPPPPYPYLVTGLPTHHPRVYNIHSRNVTRYPANSIVVVGGCPVCRRPEEGCGHKGSLPCLRTGRGSGGLLHLPGHLLGHRLVPLWVHLLFCLEEAKMPQLWSKLYLKGTARLASPHPALFF